MLIPYIILFGWKNTIFGTNFKIFDEYKYSLSKIGDLYFFFPFGLLKQIISYLYHFPMDELFVLNIYPMPFLKNVGAFCNTVENAF